MARPSLNPFAEQPSIERLCARAFGVPMSVFRKPDMSIEAVAARHAAWFVLTQRFGWPQSAITRAFRLSHGTASVALARTPVRLKTDRWFAKRFAWIESQLNDDTRRT